MTKKVVLAFSGGLDTSYCARYLSRELGYEVHAVTVQTGGFSDSELTELKKRAEALGVQSFTLLDETDAFYDRCIRYLLFGNVLKNHSYPLSVSAERVFQARAIASFAKEQNADAIAHGSTGAGNDQVRFDMVFRTVCGDIEIITPIRDLKLSREAEIAYLQDAGVSVDWTKAAYSINKGWWGTSVGGKETLTSRDYLPEAAFPSQLEHKDSRELTLSFEKGEPVALNGSKTNPVQLIQELEELAGKYAIGRDIHVGDTIIGIKGRVGFEAAAPMLCIKAHQQLEKHVLGKWQLFIKDQLADWYGNLLHEGNFLDPVMRDIEAFLQSSQQHVTGDVFIRLYPYRFVIQGIESPYDLMQSKFGSYGEMNNAWIGDDVRGFARIASNAAMIYSQTQDNHD